MIKVVLSFLYVVLSYTTVKATINGCSLGHLTVINKYSKEIIGPRNCGGYVNVSDFQFNDFRIMFDNARNYETYALFFLEHNPYQQNLYTVHWALSNMVTPNQELTFYKNHTNLYPYTAPVLPFNTTVKYSFLLYNQPSGSQIWQQITEINKTSFSPDIWARSQIRAVNGPIAGVDFILTIYANNNFQPPSPGFNPAYQPQPPQQPGQPQNFYPPQNPNFQQPVNPNYPSQNPGYQPPINNNYPPQNPNYPSQNPNYPHQSTYPQYPQSTDHGRHRHNITINGTTYVPTKKYVNTPHSILINGTYYVPSYYLNKKNSSLVPNLNFMAIIFTLFYQIF